MRSFCGFGLAGISFLNMEQDTEIGEELKGKGDGLVLGGRPIVIGEAEGSKKQAIELCKCRNQRTPLESPGNVSINEPPRVLSTLVSSFADSADPHPPNDDPSSSSCLSLSPWVP